MPVGNNVFYTLRISVFCVNGAEKGKVESSLLFFVANSVKYTVHMGILGNLCTKDAYLTGYIWWV